METSTTTTREDVRESLAEHLLGSADWRDSKAKEYHDIRSARAADAMRACAQYVRSLPSDDPRLIFLDSVSVGEPGTFMFHGMADDVSHEEENRLWGRIGYDDSMSPSDHLDLIVGYYEGRESALTSKTKALIKRINRRLARDGQRLRTTRGIQMLLDVGEHYVIDLSRNCVVDKYVDVEQLAHQLGVRV